MTKSLCHVSADGRYYAASCDMETALYYHDPFTLECRMPLSTAARRIIAEETELGVAASYARWCFRADADKVIRQLERDYRLMGYDASEADPSIIYGW